MATSKKLAKDKDGKVKISKNIPTLADVKKMSEDQWREFVYNLLSKIA